jgi:hypothetical protein
MTGKSDFRAVAGKTAGRRGRGQALEKSPGCGTRVADSRNPVSALLGTHDASARVLTLPTPVNSTLRCGRSAGFPGRGAARKRCAAEPGSLRIQKFVRSRICGTPLRCVRAAARRGHRYKRNFTARSRPEFGRVWRGSFWGEYECRNCCRSCSRLALSRLLQFLCLPHSRNSRARTSARNAARCRATAKTCASQAACQSAIRPAQNSNLAPKAEEKGGPARSPPFLPALSFANLGAGGRNLAPG